MKTRSMKQLLVLLSKQEKIFKECDNPTGLCWMIFKLLEDEINIFEYDRLNQFIKDHCKRNKKYFYYEGQIDPFYWPRGEWEPRYKWLLKQIDKLSKTK